MCWENVLDYMFSSLFTQHKFAKGYIFTRAHQKDNSNPNCLIFFSVTRMKLFVQIQM